jgi:hypothetical protein
VVVQPSPPLGGDRRALAEGDALCPVRVTADEGLTVIATNAVV